MHPGLLLLRPPAGLSAPSGSGNGSSGQCIVRGAPCPVAVTPLYAQGNDTAVFLPPAPCHASLRAHAAPWQGRALWLELALSQEVITLTDKGAKIIPGDFEEKEGFEDKKLHCHYRAAAEGEKAVFNLWRTAADLDRLVEEAEELGVQRAVGLWQELGDAHCRGSALPSL